MQLLPLSLCLLTLTGSTFSDGNGPVIIRATEGDEVTLPCYINKNIESERFDWKKDGKKKVYLYEVRPLPRDQDDQFKGRVSQLRNGDASITISDTKVSDSGDYTCNFPNLNQTSTVRLRVGPVIVRVKEGDNVILPCKINKDISLERFEWMKDGKKAVYLHETYPLAGQDDQFRGRVSHFNHELRNGDASITISDTKVSDSGDYTCDFPDPDLKKTFTVRLVVVGELKDRSREFQCKAAKVYILNPEQTEDGFLLQCEISDVSPGFKLNISWFDGSGNKLIEQINNTESENLHILQTTVKKSDTYRCVATMEELSHQVHSETYVHIPELNIPLIVGLVVAVMALIIVAAAGVIYKMKRPVFITVTESSDVILPCYIKINNILFKRFEWKKDGEEVYFLNEDGLLQSQDDQSRGRVSQLKNGDASITIIDTKVSDSGVYTCHFSNFFQTSTVHLVVEPLIITVTEGDEATLPCNIKKENIESERFEWMKDGKKVYLYEGEPLYGDQDGQFIGRVLNRGHSYLKDGDASITIYDTQESHSGVYTCHLPNLHKTFTVRLVVEKREYGPKSRLIRAEEGSFVTLPCNINEDIRSQRFEWKKDGKQVYLYEGGQSPDQDEQLKSRVSYFKRQLKKGDASITIRGTKLSDTGVYTCNFLYLNLTFIIRLLVEPLIITVTEGDEATLTCNIKNKNIESLWFEWMKDGKQVYLYEGGQGSVQDEEFSKRVSHSDHELKNGNASITISYTKLSDDGFYTCNFPNLHQTSTIYLRVGRIFITLTEGDEVTLPCNIKDINIESQRFEWKKDGKQVYLYEDGQGSVQDEEFSKRVSHSDHELKNGDASITITDTKVSDSGFYTCDFPNLQRTVTVHLHVGIPPV